MNKERIKYLLENYSRINMKLEIAEKVGSADKEVMNLKKEFDILNICVDSLEDELSAVIKLFYIRRCSQIKIARELGYSINTIKRRIDKAINYLEDCAI